MVDICFVFEVHQPFRLKKAFYWDKLRYLDCNQKSLFDFYFDNAKNKEIFERVARKCYYPANQIILEAIDEHKKERRKVKVAYSISGIFIEQCERYDKDLLDSFKQLAETKCVEFLAQTYYHSLASLYEDKSEFIEQIEMHRQAIKDIFGYKPVTFENTELLYNNVIARVAEELGFEAIFTEGVERILNGNSPNYVYKPKYCKKIKILLRNYRLTDDIGFRFSARWWDEWPLTADKYAAWLAATPGQYIAVFPDYETFGEHHWPESGIHDFLRHVFDEILKWRHLNFSTPREVSSKYEPVGEIDVFELGETVSWADIERDTSCWLGNTMQWACYVMIKDLEYVKEIEDDELIRIWRYLQTSDHLYYMFTAGGAPGEVHSYFSHYNSPYDSFVNLFDILHDFENRIKHLAKPAKDSFYFRNGVKVRSLVGFLKAIDKVDNKSFEYHLRKGDFAKWIEFCVNNKNLADEIRRLENCDPEEAKKKIKELVRKELN